MDTKVIAIASIVAVVAIKLIQKHREKNLPAGTNKNGTTMNKGTKVSNIPDDYEPYSGK